VETYHYCLPVKGNTQSTSPQTRASYITRIEFYHDRGVPLHLSVATLARRRRTETSARCGRRIRDAKACLAG
jgi:hypothetical protein